MVCGHGPSIGRSVKKGLKKAEREIKRAVPDVLSGGATAVARELGKVLTPDIPDMPDINLGSENTAPEYIMPDAEELARARRRRGQSSRSGRASTILSGNSGTQTLGG